MAFTRGTGGYDQVWVSDERLLNVGEASWAWEASVSPDRRRIAYVKPVDGDDRIFVIDLGTGRTRQTTSAWVSDLARRRDALRAAGT